MKRCKIPRGSKIPWSHLRALTLSTNIVRVQLKRGLQFSNLSKPIPAEQTGTSESPGKTLESYIAMLDDWDHERTLSDTDGRVKIDPERAHVDESTQLHCTETEDLSKMVVTTNMKGAASQSTNIRKLTPINSLGSLQTKLMVLRGCKRNVLR